jgi:hypothetical protein
MDTAVTLPGFDSKVRSGVLLCLHLSAVLFERQTRSGNDGGAED